MPPAEGLTSSAPDEAASLLVVRVGDRRVALRTDDVLEVHPMVWVSPLPDAPRGVEGVIEARGEVVAVVDLAARFGLPSRPAHLDDLLVLLRTVQRQLALHVDHDVEVRAVALRDLDVAVRADAPYAAGLAVLADGVVVVHDVDAFLSCDDELVLAAALARHERGTS